MENATVTPYTVVQRKSQSSPEKTTLIISFCTLNDEGLVAEAGRQPDLRHVGGLIDEVLNAVEDSSTGGGNATVDAPLRNGLT